jgi:hypothetical protein
MQGHACLCVSMRDENGDVWRGVSQRLAKQPVTLTFRNGDYASWRRKTTCFAAYFTACFMASFTARVVLLLLRNAQERSAFQKGIHISANERA